MQSDGELASVIHATSVVDRVFHVPVERAFALWCGPDAHHTWHVPAEGWVVAESQRDAVVGGRDLCRFGPPGQPDYLSDGRFLVIDAPRVIVSAGTMSHKGIPTASTLCTIEFITLALGLTRLVVTDQSAYFAGRHDPAAREQGWQIILEAFSRVLSSAAFE